MNVRTPAPADLGEVLALCQGYEIDVLGESDWTEDDLREEWERKLDLERNAWLVELEGRIAGYGTFADRGEGRLIGDGYVHPELRGRGVGARLLELYEERAAGIDGARTIESGTLAADPAADRLFTTRGYAAVRHFWRMVADLDAEPEPPAWPAGVEAAPFDTADAEEPHAALNESFAEEWGHAPQSFEDFLERIRSPRFDASLCVVAKERREIVGLSLSDWKRMGDWGWIGSLSVRSGWRGRGLGEALLRASFAEFFRRGERRVALGVDAENPTGATRLYERVGMHVVWEAVVYKKALDA